MQSQQDKVDLEVGGRRDSLAAKERQLRVGIADDQLHTVIVTKLFLDTYRVRYRKRWLQLTPYLTG